MSINLFFKGLIIGFSIAAPVEPISIVCMRSTLADGTIAVFISGLGAAALLLPLTNPMTNISFAAVLAGLGLEEPGGD